MKHLRFALAALTLFVGAVFAPRPAAAHLILVWGTPNSNASPFGSLRGVALGPQRRLYFADYSRNRVEVYSRTGDSLFTFGTPGSGPGQFNNPFGVGVEPDSNVYVVDQANNRIQVFTADGAYVRQWGSLGHGVGQLAAPTYIAFDSTGNVYVADYWDSHIEEFTPRGTFIRTWGTPGAGNGQFSQTYGVVVDDSGFVYADDFNQNRVEKFTGDGQYLSQWGTSGPGPGQLWTPQAMAIDRLGDVFVVDNTGRVQVFSRNGVYLTGWDASMGLYWPIGIAVDEVGDSYVACNGYVLKFGNALAAIEPAAGGDDLELAPALPNPSRGSTRLRFSLPRPAWASLTLYDLGGRRVAAWRWSALEAGAHEVAWDGRADDGRPVPPGVFFARLSVGARAVGRTLVRLR